MELEKKSFVLYADLISTVEILNDKQRGDLFLCILKFVNQQEFQIEDIAVKVALEPVKLQITRDSKKYEAKKKAQSLAGKRSADIRKSSKSDDIEISTKLKNVEVTSTNLKHVEVTSTNLTDNGNGTDNVNENDKVIILDNSEFEFSIKNVHYKGAPSLLAKSSEYISFLNTRLKTKKVELADFIKTFDEEYNGISFEDIKHFKNSINLIIKNLANGYNKKNDRRNEGSKSFKSASNKDFGANKF